MIGKLFKGMGKGIGGIAKQMAKQNTLQLFACQHAQLIRLAA